LDSVRPVLAPGGEVFAVVEERIPVKRLIDTSFGAFDNVRWCLVQNIVRGIELSMDHFNVLNAIVSADEVRYGIAAHGGHAVLGLEKPSEAALEVSINVYDLLVAYVDPMMVISVFAALSNTHFIAWIERS